MTLTSLAVAAILAVAPPPAQACSPPEPLDGHLLDFAEQGSDTQPPTKPVVGAIETHRPEDNQSGLGCDSKCAPAGQLSIALSASDDRTPTDQIGYRIRVLRGQAPYVPTMDSRARDGQLWFAFDREADLSFDLLIHSVDRAGNISAEGVQVTVNDSPGACHLGASGRRPGLLSLLVAISIGLAGASRRRRASASPRGLNGERSGVGRGDT